MNIDKHTTARLMKEYRLLQTSLPPSIHATPQTDTLDTYEASIEGPPDTPYAGGRFLLTISLSPQYPIEPPTVKFRTRVYHPNIDEHGNICLEILKAGSSGKWGPAVRLHNVLMALVELLRDPNPRDPLVDSIAREMQDDFDAFVRNATACTKSHAMSFADPPEELVGVSAPKRAKKPQLSGGGIRRLGLSRKSKPRATPTVAARSSGCGGARSLKRSAAESLDGSRNSANGGSSSEIKKARMDASDNIDTDSIEATPDGNCAVVEKEKGLEEEEEGLEEEDEGEIVMLPSTSNFDCLLGTADRECDAEGELEYVKSPELSDADLEDPAQSSAEIQGDKCNQNQLSEGKDSRGGIEENCSEGGTEGKMREVGMVNGVRETGTKEKTKDADTKGKAPAVTAIDTKNNALHGLGVGDRSDTVLYEKDFGPLELGLPPVRVSQNRKLLMRRKHR